MYGFGLTQIYEKLRNLGLTSSRAQFSVAWCGRNAGYLKDLERRQGASARVSSRSIDRIRRRLAEARRYLPRDVASQVAEIETTMDRYKYVADLLGRRSIDAIG